MGGFDAIAPNVPIENLTKDHIKKFIESVAGIGIESAPDSTLIEANLKGLKMKMKLSSSKARVYQLAFEYDKRMENIGCGPFRSNNPKKAILHIIDAMHPAALKAQMKNNLEYIPKLKEDCKKFLRHSATKLKLLIKASGVLSKLKLSWLQNQLGTVQVTARKVQNPPRNRQSTRNVGSLVLSQTTNPLKNRKRKFCVGTTITRAHMS